jgi:DNA polymerase-1
VSTQQQSLYVIDGPGLAYQAFHAISGLTAEDGTPTGAVYGFVALLRKLLHTAAPAYLVVAWDHRGPTFRHELDETYKATRKPMPEDLAAQLPVLREVLEGFRVPLLEVPGFEADDIMATLARQGVDAGLDVVLVTRDKDCKQLLGPGVRMYDSKQESYLDATALQEQSGVTPQQWVHLQALMGDSSDNIKGAPGIGLKTATKLLATHASLDDIYAHLDEVEPKRTRTLLEQGRDSAYRALELVTLRQDLTLPAELEELRYPGPDPEALTPLYQRLGFRRFLGEVLEAPVGPDPDYLLITDEEALRGLAARLRGAGRCGLAVYPGRDGGPAGLAVALGPGEASYVPLASPAATVPTEAVAAILGEALADEQLPKVGHDLKAAWHLLRRAGLTLGGIADDTALAAYLLNPSSRAYDLRTLAVAHLGRRAQDPSEVLGSGKSARCLDELHLAKACSHAAEAADLTLQLRAPLRASLEQAELLQVYTEMELPLVPVLARLEARGLLLECERLQAMAAELRQEIAAIESRAHQVAGEPFNLGSPKQLQHILFEVRGLEPVKKGKTGPSTDAASLEQIHAVTDDPLCGLILRYRELSKLLSTYVEALPELVDPADGRLHTVLHQTVAATGRLSSSDPNLQNIPVRTELGRRIRGAFVAPSGHLLVTGDYSQIELRVLAHFSRDEELLRSFTEGRDIHRAVAAQITGAAYEDVDPDSRRRAKAVNFGVIYGQSAHGLSRELGIPRREAQAFIDQYFETFPGVRAWIDRTIAAATEAGEVRTMSGRRRPIPELASSNRARHSLGERLAVNTVIQGSAADLLKQAMLSLDARIRREGRPERLLLQIHDELLLECPEADAPAAMAVLQEELEGVEGLSVPLVVNTSAAASWGDLK